MTTFISKNAGQSDLSGSDSDEDQDISINNKDNDINNFIAYDIELCLFWHYLNLMPHPPHNCIELGLLINYVAKYLSDLYFDKAALYPNMYALSEEFEATANEIKVFYGNYQFFVKNLFLFLYE